MKLIRIISDTVTSRGIFQAGAEVSLEDAEAASCVKNGLGELVEYAEGANEAATDHLNSKSKAGRKTAADG